jgi:hypothetical protein
MNTTSETYSTQLEDNACCIVGAQWEMRCIVGAECEMHCGCGNGNNESSDTRGSEERSGPGCSSETLYS